MNCHYEHSTEHAIKPSRGASNGLPANLLQLILPGSVRYITRACMCVYSDFNYEYHLDGKKFYILELKYQDMRLLSFVYKPIQGFTLLDVWIRQS
jgi:hypothetical protein